jgi:hypothetical protein
VVDEAEEDQGRDHSEHGEHRIENQIAGSDAVHRSDLKLRDVPVTSEQNLDARKREKENTKRERESEIEKGKNGFRCVHQHPQNEKRRNPHGHQTGGQAEHIIDHAIATHSA